MSHVNTVPELHRKYVKSDEAEMLYALLSSIPILRDNLYLELPLCEQYPKSFKYLYEISSLFINDYGFSEIDESQHLNLYSAIDALGCIVDDDLMYQIIDAWKQDVLRGMKKDARIYDMLNGNFKIVDEMINEHTEYPRRIVYIVCDSDDDADINVDEYMNFLSDVEMSDELKRYCKVAMHTYYYWKEKERSQTKQSRA